MIKYLGSKRKLVSWVLKAILENFPNTKSVLDIFSGTSRVGIALKNQGFQVFSNDHNLFAYHLAHCYIETDKNELPLNFNHLIDKLNSLSGKEGFFTKNYCLNARFFHPNNGAKIEEIREYIENLKLEPKIKSVLLVSLMEAADRVDSTCGMQMSYLKSYAKRALNPLLLKIPDLLEKSPYGQGKAFCLDALEAASKIESDVAYLDPPYNQHSYRGNYHIWETLVRWDAPKTYGIAQKREDCQTFKSDFNQRKKFAKSLSDLINTIKAKNIVLSFSNEGFSQKNDLEKLLHKFGSFKLKEIDYKRYIGAQIGIYNPKGEKVGQVKKLHNKELIYVLNKY